MNDTKKQKARVGQAHKRENRYEQLLSLAHEGNEEAWADLWKEFGVAPGEEAA